MTQTTSRRRVVSPDTTRGVARERTPPGQVLTQKWPVLHYGPVPTFNPKTWDLRVFGKVKNELRWTWDELQALDKELHALVTADTEAHVAVVYLTTRKIVRRILRKVAAEEFDQLGDVEGTAQPLQILPQRGETLESLALGHDVERAAMRHEQRGTREDLHMPGLAAARPPHAFGDDVEPAHVGRVEREHLVGLTQLTVAEDDRLGLVNARGLHGTGKRSRPRAGLRRLG